MQSCDDRTKVESEREQAFHQDEGDVDLTKLTTLQ